DGKFAFVTLGEYTAQVGADLKNISASQVAVIYADGAIVDGEGVYGGYVYGNTLATTLAKVRDDDRVKSVVLRVNSPGGSALASDVIWREMELLRAKKPVIVSMGSYAASGGYYISAPADAVVADRMTLTGSIGVYGMYLNTVDALKNKLGITLDAVKTNTSAGMGTTGALTAAERGSVMRGVDKVYTTFTNHVAAGRNLPIEKVLAIAGGRVWTGAEAQGIGLIDTYGGLKTAIAVAADKAELGDAYRVVEVLEQPEGLAALFSGLLSQARAHLESSELGVMMKQYRKVQEITSQQGVVMYEPRTFTLEEFSFEAAHALEGYDGACREIHGHSYRFYVTVKGSPSQERTDPKYGMVIDFGVLKTIVNEEVVSRLDHALVLHRTEASEPLLALLNARFSNLVET
ncbi:MAG: signal peptide peptidase SppA, partial [Alistipes sp.]